MRTGLSSPMLEPVKPLSPRARFWIIEAIVLLSVMNALIFAWIASPLWL